MIRLRRLSNSQLESLHARESQAEVDYPETGATRGDMPHGYRHDRLSTVIGTGRDTFERAAEYLLQWDLQKSMGFAPHPYPSSVTEGGTILLTVPIGPLHMIAPARVIYVESETNRRGFAYGTLASHPETGEEYFGVSLEPDNTVRFELVAFSKPGTLLTRLGGPFTRYMQAKAIRRYLQMMERDFR